MATPNPTFAVGVFEKPGQAIDAAKALLKADFPAKELVLVAREWHDDNLNGLGIETQQAAGSGAVKGAAIGGAVGVAAGALTLLIPGIGAGVVGLAALAAMTGAATGSLVGPFIAMEMTSEEARSHGEHLEKGRTVLVVRSKDRQDEARSLMVANGAYDYSMHTT